MSYEEIDICNVGGYLPLPHNTPGLCALIEHSMVRVFGDHGHSLLAFRFIGKDGGNCICNNIICQIFACLTLLYLRAGQSHTVENLQTCTLKIIYQK